MNGRSTKRYESHDKMRAIPAVSQMGPRSDVVPSDGFLPVVARNTRQRMMGWKRYVLYAIFPSVRMGVVERKRLSLDLELVNKESRSPPKMIDIAVLETKPNRIDHTVGNASYRIHSNAS